MGSLRGIPFWNRVAVGAVLALAGCETAPRTPSEPPVADIRFDEKRLAGTGLSTDHATDVILILELFRTGDYRRLDAEQWAEIEPDSIRVTSAGFEGWYWPEERRLIEKAEGALLISPSIDGQVPRLQ